MKNKVWKYEESTQDGRLSASLLEKNTKPDTPAEQRVVWASLLMDATIV